MAFGRSELRKSCSIIRLETYRSRNVPTDFAEEAKLDAIQTIYSRILNSAKRSNVVFYTLDPAGLTSSVGENNTPRKIERSSSLNLHSLPRKMINSMFQQNGEGGGSGGGPGGGSMPGRSRAYPGSKDYRSTNTDGTSMVKQQSLLNSLASDTGGLSIYNTNDFDSELDKLDQRLSNYYVLGFQSNNPKHDGKFRKIEVKTDLKGVSLEYQTSYLDRRPVDLLASSKQERALLKAMDAPEEENQIPIIFRANYFYDSPQLARVVVLSKISPAELELRKKGGTLTSALNVMGVAYADDGNISARFSETLQISVDKTREQEFRKSRVGYRNYFKLRPGRYRLKLAISDDANNLGSAEQSFEVPPFPENGLAASSLVLAEDFVRLPDLIRNLKARLLDESEILLFAGMQIIPSVDNKIPVGAPLSVFFKVYRSSFDDQTTIIGKAKLVNKDGGEMRILPSTPLESNLGQSKTGESMIGLRLLFEGTVAGKYTLRIEVSDGISPQPLELQTDIELTHD